MSARQQPTASTPPATNGTLIAIVAIAVVAVVGTMKPDKASISGSDKGPKIEVRKTSAGTSEP